VRGPVWGNHAAGGWRQGTRHGSRRLGALCQVLNRFKPSKSIQTRSNLFEIILKLIHSKRGLPEFKKFKIKYGFDGFAERNNFLYSNFFRLEMGFELKFGEFKVCFLL
jgi:hypothetical protein